MNFIKIILSYRIAFVNKNKYNIDTKLVKIVKSREIKEDCKYGKHHTCRSERI